MKEDVYLAKTIILPGQQKNQPKWISTHDTEAMTYEYILQNIGMQDSLIYYINKCEAY